MNKLISVSKVLISAVILITVLEMLLANKSSKKYVKIVFGFFLLYIMISSFLNKKIDISNFTIKNDDNDIYKNLISIDIVNNVKENEYMDQIKNSIVSEVEKSGYKIEIEDLKLDGFELYSISINALGKVSKKELNSTANNIQIDKVSIGNLNETDDMEEEEAIVDTDISIIKNILINTYGFKEERIYIEE